MTTLDELKLAIGEFQEAASSEYALSADVMEAKFDAMKVAFEWREGWRERWENSVGQELALTILEGKEGMALIRKHLT
jgi:hypothetical protein